MDLQSDNIYALPQMQALLSHELTYLAPTLSNTYGQYVLFITPSASAFLLSSSPLLAMLIELKITTQSTLSGNVICTSDLLPFTNESIAVLLIHHAGELVTDLERFTSELIRVLAPEGTIFILGTNPHSFWRPWLRWKTHNSPFQYHFQSLRQWRISLAREHIEIFQVRYLGPFFPRPKMHPKTVQKQGSLPLRLFSGLRGSYLLLARKRRSILTPIKLSSQLKKTTLQPGLASSASRNDI